MFGFPSYYAPRYAPEPRRRAPAAYDPFGEYSDGYSRPTHRPQAHTSFSNPFGYQQVPRYQYPQYEQEDSSEEEEEYPERPQRVPPQHQVRLDTPPEYLTPQQRYYLQQQQLQQQKELQRQRELQRQKELLQQQQQQQQQQHHQHQRRHHHQQQAQQQPQPQQQKHPQPIKIHTRAVDLDKEARKIQRRWRGWDVRKHDLISKLRAIKKIDNEVDALTATPVNQQILSLSPLDPHFPLDTQFVGKIPRNVLAIEHELTAKLIALDEISGGVDIVRQSRKALVSKIEGILSRVDAVKKVFASMDRPTKTEVDGDSVVPPPPTPPTSTFNPAATEHVTPLAMDIEQPDDNKKKEREEDSVRESGERDSSGSFIDNMNNMAIQDVSDNITPTISSPPIVEAAMPSVTSSFTITPTPTIPITIPTTTTTTTTRQIPTLKHMCYDVCDKLIRKAVSL